MEKERLSGTLTRNNRPLISYLGGLGFDQGTVAAATRFGNKLERDARVWLARGRIGERGRISRLDAEIMWRDHLVQAGAE